MPQLTANDLKTRGVAAIESLLAGQPEAMISVRGKDRYVVMDIAHYHYLRECELDSALAQSQADIAASRFVAQSAQQHVAELEAMLVADGGAAPRKAAANRLPPVVRQVKAKIHKATTAKTTRRSTAA